MQMITPIDIDDTNMTSSVAEPDASHGEEVWASQSEGMADLYTFTGEALTSIQTSDGYIYAAGDLSLLEVIKTDTATDTVTTLGALTGPYRASAITSEGVMYALHSGYDYSILKLDTTTDSVSEITGSSIYGFFYSAAAGFSDNIYAVGVMADTGFGGKVLKIDTSDDSLTSISLASGAAQWAATTGTDGNIYSVGATSEVTRINEADDSVDTFGAYSGVYYASTLGSDGYIYCVGSSGTILKIDTDNDSVETIGAYLNTYKAISQSSSSGLFYCSGDDGYIMHFDSSTEEVTELADSSGNLNSIQAVNDGVYFIGDEVISKTSEGYNTGDQVILTDTHTLYQSAIDNNFDEPVVGSALTAPSWVEVSATNKYRAFDYTINTVSTMATSTAEITLTPGEICTTISLYGLGDISTVYIKVYNGSTSGTLLYDESQDLTINQPVEDSIVNDNYYRDKVMFDDLPATYSNPHIVITFDSAEDEIEVGDVVIGNARTMGAMVYESSTTRTSYDTVDTDDYGNETITSRPSAEYTTFELFVEPDYADYVERMLKSSLNKIRVYVGDKNSTEKLFTLGYYERSPITYDAPMKCSTTLKVRGLV